ncbi:hypothetical protein HMPREF9225_0089 [Peptoniphilus duerdenii ATCC BAA-1640]|uniref:Uncharacterized protein n=1 Tax=Peptoniphilus duerdenii ATCC BAA-1640 TaxID=862517 RepID=E0NIV0_9FIRM|nr:hypothetical protein HMPREF9225_0089 [Peptoniphilus duerdenii ATCC BAA-1640]
MHRLDLRRLYPFEALAEIFDFAAGLVQRVPKKASIAKLDLQNSTASQGDRSWEGVLYIIPEEDSRPERRVEVYRHTRSRMGITLVGLCTDDFLAEMG